MSQSPALAVPRWNPRVLLRALLVGACAFLLGGCVFLRLLQLKNQLSKFDEYFEADMRDGLKLTFKKPVMLDKDFEEFFKWIPESRQMSGTAEKWHFRWLKERVVADGARPPYAVEFDFYFTDHKLAKFVAPESFFATFLPKKMALAMLRGLGGAKIDQHARSMSFNLEASGPDPLPAELPTQAGLKKMLGEPVEIAGDETAPQWRYRFSPATPNQRLGRGGIDVTFTIDPASGNLRRMKGVSLGMSIDIDFGEATPKETVGDTAEKPTAPEAAR